MSKWFLLLNDKWKILRWLTVKIKNYFYVTLDDMCTITWNKFLFKKKKTKLLLKLGSQNRCTPYKWPMIIWILKHQGQECGPLNCFPIRLRVTKKASSFGITCWFLLVLAIKLVRKEGIGKVLCFTFFGLIFSFWA